MESYFYISQEFKPTSFHYIQSVKGLAKVDESQFKHSGRCSPVDGLCEPISGQNQPESERLSGKEEGSGRPHRRLGSVWSVDYIGLVAPV